MAITPFGKEARKARLDRDMMLKDQADAMGVSPTFVSAIEAGRKPVPAGYVQRMTTALSLSADEVERLEDAIGMAACEHRIVVSSATPAVGREAAMLMARNFNRLSEDDLTKLRDLLARR